MPIETGAGIGKVAGLIVRPLFNLVRSQVGRRGAQSIADADPALLEKEISEAISVLRRSSDSLGSQIWTSAKAVISEPPPIFDDPEARGWLGRADVQDLLGRATLAMLARQDLEPFEAEAKHLYGGDESADTWYGAPLFEYSIAFIALSLREKIDTSAKVVLAAGAAQHEEVRERLSEIQENILKTNRTLERLDLGSEPAVDAMDRFLDAEIDRLEAYRSIVDTGAVPRLMDHAMRALTGNLAGASPRVRSKLFRYAAATQAREGNPDEADEWIGHAEAIGVDDLATDRARIALARERADDAIAILGKRDDRISNSLRIEAIKKRDGQSEAISYFDAYCRPEAVSGYFLVSLATWLATSQGVAAGERLLAMATAEQEADNKTLRFVRMRMRLALLAPEPADIVANYSLLPAPGGLRDDAEGRRLNSLARADARVLLEDIKGHPNPYFAELVELTRQYLGLVSGDEAVIETAKAEIRAYMTDPETRTTYVSLATLFDIDFDRQELAAQLDQAARLAPWDNMQLRAAFDLEVTSGDPDRIAAFVDTHRDRLAEVVGARQSVGVSVEALAKAGRVTEARARLDAVGSDLLPSELAYLQGLVSESAGEGLPDLHLARFEATGDEQDLALTVQSMRATRDGRLPDFASRLWALRRRLDDAVVAANAYAWFGRDLELRDFLESLGDSVMLDTALETHLAWIRYREGRLNDADQIVSRLRAADPDDASLRQLRINLLIEAGEWHGLGALFKEDLERAEQRSSQQLLQSAALATASKNPDAKALIAAAASRSDGDAHVYANAFELALRRGEDLEDTSLDYLNNAIELSGDEGPLQPLAVREIIAARDQRLEHIAIVDRMMLSGEVTISQASKPLGTTLPAMIIAHSDDNQRRSDARGRFHLPLFAGNRETADLGEARRIAIEPTALLTLHILDLVPSVFEAFETIILAPGTLPSLLENLLVGDRGQPSRAARAEQVLRLQGLGRLEVIETANLAGDTEECLFALADEAGGRFVHIPPIYVAGSFGEEIRDPAPFAARLASVSGILTALVARGEISATDAERARRFPSVRKGWPDEAPIDLSAPLVIDAVALHYLIDAGLVAALERLGTRLIVSSDVIANARSEIEEHRANEALKDEIDRLRASLNVAIRSGKAIIGPSLQRRSVHPPSGDPGDLDAEADMLGDDDLDIFPLAAILRDNADAEWLVADDRVVNQHGLSTDERAEQSRVATSLDILAHLEKKGVIDAARRDAALSRLRAGGLGLIPVTVEQIVAAASEGDWTHGPSRSLRILRDSILLPILRKSVLIPLERHWIEQTVLAVAVAIKEVFGTLSPEAAEKAATFLLGILPDVRALAATNPSPEAQLWGETIATGMHALLSTPINLQDEALEHYLEWYGRGALEKLQGRDAALFDGLVARLRRLVQTHRPALDLPPGTRQPSRVQIARWVLGHLPFPLRLALVRDPDVREAIGRTRVVTLGETRVAQPDLIRFLADVANERPAELRDTKGNLLTDGGTMHPDGSVTTSGEATSWRFAQAGLHSPDKALRRQVLEEFFDKYSFAPSREAFWLEAIDAGPLDAEGFHALANDSNLSAEEFVQDFAKEMLKDDFEIQTLANRPAEQFLAIAETAAETIPLDEMLSVLAARRRQGARPLVTALTSATLAVAPGFSMLEFTGPLTAQEAASLGAELLDHGDPFSLLAAFELACAHPSDPACRELGDLILAALWGEEGKARDITADFCIASIMTLVMTRWHGTLASWPLAGRRLACFAHAGVICRVLAHFDIERPELLSEVRGWFGPRLRLGGLLDLREAREWSPRQLVPAAIEGILLRRFDALLDTLAEEDRPASWITALTAAVEVKGGDANAFLRLPGPLDEFSDKGFKRPTVSLDEFETLLPEFEGAPSEQCADMIFRMAVLFAPPTADIGDLSGALLRHARAAEGELRSTYQLVLFQLADMWTLPDVAEAAADLLPIDGRSGPAIAEQALAVAAAHPDAATQHVALESHMMRYARTVESGLSAESLAAAIEILINGEPQLAPLLDPARTCAALAA